MSDRPAGGGPHDVKALMAQALVELRDAKARARQLEDRAHAPVAIVGIGCRFPGGADSPEAFRELLWAGTDAIERVPDARWDSQALFDPNPDAAGKISSPFGGFIRDVDRFDAEFFGISPREAESMDPQHRLLLETAWRALEHANIPPSQLRGTDTGVFVGICTYDYAIRHLAGGSDCGTAYFGTGNALSAAAGRLSYLFGFTGPSLSVDTACSSSLVSVHLACQALRHGECRAALAGGVNLILAPQTSISFSRAHMLAPDGRCKPFDASANGYVRGEGCGVIVLKLLADAQRDRDPILAVIRGSAINQDGASSGLTVPSGPAQQEVIRQALANSRLRQADIGYVEAHGTGTALGDPIEARSVAAAYCSERELGSPLWVGSVKSNIGHLEGAAGIASLIKAALAVRHGVIPPSLHFASPNPNIEWLFSGIRIPTEAQPWTGSGARIAGISSFGFTGTNAHVIVEAPPAAREDVGDGAAVKTPADGLVMLPISARDPDALERLIHEYRSMLATAPCFADVAAAAALGREHFKHRRAVVAGSGAEAAALLTDGVQSAPKHAAGSLAARYESGADVDLAPLFDPAARGRVHVPAYPFLGERHWLEEKEAAAATTARETGRGLVTDLVLNASDLFIDHEVFGRVLVPATALVEMILSAGRQACGSDQLILEDFTIHRPLSLERDAAKQVRILLEPGADGFHAAIVVPGSRRADERIAEGRIRAGTAHAAAPDAQVDAPLPESDTRLIPSMYEAWRARGLNYGPAFQTLSRVDRRDPIVRAEIELPAAQRQARGYYVHPALLDGCLQAAAFSYPVPAAEQLYLPVSIRRITTCGPASSALRCETLLVRADAQRVETDLRIRAADGTLLAVVEGITLRAGTARGLDAALHDAPLQRLVPQWIEVPAAPSPAMASIARRRTQGVAEKREWHNAAAPPGVETTHLVVTCPATAEVSEIPALLLAVLSVIQRTAARSTSLARLVFVTQGAQAVGGAARTPALAAIAGLVRSAQAEFPGISIVCLDADPDHDCDDLLNEDLFKAELPELAYRDGKRYVRHLQAVAGADREPDRARLTLERPAGERRPIRGDRSYMITGGLGDIGLHIAGWLADRGAGAIILLGRGAATTTTQAQRLQELRRKADVRVYAVDVADSLQLDRCFAQASAELPPIAGIVHAAGVTRDAIVANQTPAHLRDAWRPKAVGARNLFGHARALDVDGLVCISSIAGTFGAAGQANYAAANAYLESFVSWARAEGVPAQCLSYGPWDDTGMARALNASERARLEQRGVDMLPPAAAIHELERLWDSGDPLRVVFAGAAPGPRALDIEATPHVAPSVVAVGQLVASILRMPADRIAPDVPLTAIGLDSLMALELRNRCLAEFGVDIPAVEFIRDLTVAQIVERVAAASTSELRAEDARERPTEDTALSQGQRALWYLHQMQPESPAYNIAFAVRIRSAVDEVAFTAALRSLTARHGQLRTVYRETDAGPRQIVRSEAGPVYVRHDAAGLDERELHRRVVDDYRKPFDLANGPVMRVSLFSSDRENHVLSIVIHHIAADAWSLWRLMEEFRALYQAETAGARAELPETGYGYADKVDDEARFVLSAAGDAAWEYWRHELSGELPLLSLPTDTPRPAVQTLNGASVPFSVTMEESERLQEIARQEGTTLYALLATAYQVLLHRYSGQDDIIVGCPAAGRNRSEAAGTVGYFVNPIVVRARFAQDQPFRVLLRETRARILDGMAHQDLPFPVIAERLGGPRQAGHSPVFQAAFVMQQLAGDSLFAAVMTPSDPPLRVDWGGLQLEHYFLPQQEGQFDLTLEMVHANGACHGLFKYNTDLWHADTIGRMAQHFRALLLAVIQDPGERVDRLAILPAEERATLEGWNRTGRDYDLERPLHAWIEEQAARTPTATAVEIGQQALTYAELNSAANRLARALQRRGVAAGDPVPILAERSLALVVGLLGTLKSGGAYVPLDPSYPVERLRFMIGDLSPKAVLVMADTRHLAIGESALVVDVEEMLGGSSSEDRVNLPFAANSESPAYTIYTSGSTGAPKGAVNTHRGIVNRLLWMQEAFQLTAGDRVLQKTPYGFDVSVWEFFWPLMTGARLVLARPDGHKDNTYLADLIQQAGITTLHFVPPMLQAFLEEPAAARCESLRRVICSGQELPAALQRRFFETLPAAELHNLYGPTEAAVDVTWHHCMADDRRTFVPIGRPIANTSIYILDRAGQPAPIGVPGELLIGGVQVARGYLNRPELTAEKFVPDPFNPFDRANSTMYRTGDLARFLPDGEIEFLGRSDFQVKIRGLRVELGEIEHALTAHPQVREAVVLLREDRPGTKRLTAYLVADADAAPQLEGELRSALAASLPDYMIPDAFVRLDVLPLTSNGKVDRRALPAPPSSEVRSRPPQSEAERRLAEIWKAVLGIDAVGAGDNFFSLGGDSIRSTQMVARARRDGFILSVRDVLATPTIAALAEKGGGGDLSSTPPLKLESSSRPESGIGNHFQRTAPLMPMQRWFFAPQLSPLNRFNQAIVLKTGGVPQPEALREALQDLIVRHDALRLRFPTGPAEERQQICVAPEQASIHLSHWAPGADVPLAAAVEECQRAFNLATGPLAAALSIDDPADPRILLVAHHLIVDGVSWRVLLGDLELAYRARLEGRRPVFAEEASSCLDWAHSSAKYAATPAAESEALYWLSEDWSQDVARLPVFDGDVEGTRVGEVLFDIPCEAVTRGDDDPSGYAIEAALLASFSTVIGDSDAEQALRVDLEGHGREPLDRDTDGSAVVGWCTALYPMLLRIEGEAFSDRIASVERQLAEVPAGGRAFGLCRYLSPRTRVRDGLARVPQAEILFNYLGRLDDDGSGTAASDRLFTLALPDASMLHSADTPRYPLEIIAWREGERVHVSLRVDRARLSDAWATRLADRWTAQMAGSPRAAYPLTSMQKGILFHALLNPDAGLYVQQVVVACDGHPDLSLLRRAWDEVLAHHSILRTTFLWKGLEAPVQQVAASATMPWTIEDWRDKGGDAFDTALEQFLDDDRARGIDVTIAPLQRVRLFLREGSCTMVWTHHHLLLDGRSLFLVLRDVLEAARALGAGRRPALSSSTSFGRFAATLDTVDAAPALAYWRGQLADVDAPTALPFLQRASDPPHYRAAEIAGTLSSADARALAGVAREAGVTLNLLMQSLLALFIGRLSGSDRVLFGATVSSERPADDAVGLFINTIPIRVDVPAAGELGAWLGERLRAQADRSPFEQLALVDIQRCSAVAAGHTLFDLLFLFENYPVDEALRAPAPVAVTGVRVVERTNYPLVLSVLPGEQIDIRLLHDTSRYAPGAAALFVDGYVSMLRSVAQAGGAGLATRLDRVAPMDETSRQRVLHDWNATGRAYPRDRRVHELVFEQAALHPDVVAVRSGDTSLTYGQLAARGRQIAAYLRGVGVGAGSLVGLCVERGPELIPALLGILESGAAYVPLDPAFPADRLAYMAEDSGAALIISERGVDVSLRERLGGHTSLVLLEEIPATEAPAEHAPPAEPGDLMYVIYTSGSTGRPKGVMIPHQSVVNFLCSMAAEPGLAAGDVLLAVTTLSFDIAVLELFLPLIAGARIVLADRAADPRQLMRLIDEESVTVLQATPATWRMLLAAGWTGSARLRAFCGGEALPRDLSRALLRRCAEVWNLYGPTETTVWSAIRQVRDEGDDHVDGVEPIGRPIANTSLYILDAALRPVPVGAPGELYIGGDGLARGYHGNPQMTAERFVRNPFAPEHDARIYRTGDRARFRPDGEVEFLGRLDHQVKLRGHRIELGEIESVLGMHPLVGHAVVMIREDRPGEARLIAYYTGRAGAAIDDAMLREQVRTRLPDYMMPSRFVRVERMPLTPNGKVDRLALPAPDPVRHEAGSQGLRSRVEREVAGVWSEVLGDEGFPAEESFFNLGGHSLHLVRVQTRIAARLGVDLDIVEFFRHPSIRQLGALIERRQSGVATEEGAAPNRSAARLSRLDARQQQQHIRRDARARTRPELRHP